MRANEIMSHPVITLTASASVAAAAQLLARHGFTAVPVTDDDGHLIGIVTEADLIRNRIPADPRIHGATAPLSHRSRRENVGTVMTTSVESLTPGADVADIARMMLAEHIRCFPIVDGGAVVGIVTRRDLLNAAIGRNDQDKQMEISAMLERLGESGRWNVSVQGGVADIEDFGESLEERLTAERMAASVPGVVAAHAHHQTSDPF